MATPAKTASRPATAQQATGAATKPAAAAAKPAQAAARPAAATKPVQGQVISKEASAGDQAPAVRETTTVVGSMHADLPAHIRRDVVRGSENVETSDLVIPRIELVQALSRCLDEKNEGLYIEGAKPGMLYNSVTRRLYGPNLFFIPVYYMKQFLGWRDRKKGGGFCGAYDTIQECEAEIERQEIPEEWEAIETGQQLILVIDPETLETEEAILSCSRTKFKVSRQLNSLIRIHGFDRFSRSYELFGVDEQNSNNESYKNLGFRLDSWTPVAAYKAAERLYNDIKTGGRKVKMDEKFEDAGTPEESGGGADPAQPAEY